MKKVAKTNKFLIYKLFNHKINKEYLRQKYTSKNSNI